MRFIIFAAAIFLFATNVSAQEKSPYGLFDKNGKKASYSDLVKAAAKSDVVLFGELHDNAIAHWLELELGKDVSERKPVVLGAEMLETDNQQPLDQYLKKELSAEAFENLDRIWPNYVTDYKPLVDLAQQKGVPFIATNVSQKYAHMVYKQGFEALEGLSVAEKKLFVELPFPYDPTLSQYARIVEAMQGDTTHGGENLPKAQAFKDATMAQFIFKNLREGSVFLHFNGAYHSDFFQGIYWYLKKSRPDLKILTISTVSQKDPNQLEKENGNLADFIIAVDEDMTKTYPDRR